MDLEHSFTVPVPRELAWNVLLDVERVAPCMPGATLDSVDGDVITGKIKVKVGPIAMTYAGTARFTERDEPAGVVVLEASGKETRGAGTASASVRSVLEGRGDETHVTVYTTLNVTGRPAQFGRGVMAEVGGKLIGIFASNLADMLAAEGAESAESAAGPGREDESSADAEGDLAGARPSGSGARAGTAAAVATTPIEELNLPVRAFNSLRREGLHTVADLTARTADQLLAIDGIGPASVEDIRQKLADRGLALGQPAASGNGAAPPPAPAQPGPEAAAGPGSEPPRQAAWAGSRSARSADDDAIDLLSVAGLPVLKRALPVAAALAAAALIALRARIRRRRRRA
jgi:carbon monoxide dehydrogenase subunit G